MKIEDILKLTPYWTRNELSSEVVSEVFDINCGYIFGDENITTANYMHDRCWDSRSRTVEVVSFKGIACIALQYLGKGDYNGFVMLDTKTYKELGLYLFEKTLDEMIRNFPEEKEMNIQLYGANEFAIINNKMICSEKPIAEEERNNE